MPTGEEGKSVGKRPLKSGSNAAMPNQSPRFPSSIAIPTGDVNTICKQKCYPLDFYNPLRMRPSGRWGSHQTPRLKEIPRRSLNKDFPTPVVIVNRLFSRGKTRVNPWRPGGKKKGRKRYHEELVAGVRDSYGDIDVTGVGEIGLDAFPEVNTTLDISHTPPHGARTMFAMTTC